MNAGTVLKSLAGAIGSFAPTLATMLGGPLAGTAVSALERAFGLAPGSGPEAITQVVQSGAMTPELIAKVREEDQKHAEVMGQQSIDLAKINADYQTSFNQDRADARNMQIQTKDPNVARLAWLMIGGFMVITCGIIVGLFLVPERAHALLSGEAGLFFGTVFGYLANGARGAEAFYFGSTQASQSKDATIADIAKSP